MQVKNPDIRLAVPSDIGTIRNMMDVAVRRLPSRDWYVDDDVDYISRHIDGPDGYTLIYMVEGRDAGFLLIHHPGISEKNLGRYLSLPDQELTAVTHMESSCVLPEYQGRHILSLLLEEAIVLERAAGCRYVMSTVHPDNIFSKNSHLRLGFEEVTTVRKYNGWMRTVMLMRI